MMRFIFTKLYRPWYRNIFSNCNEYEVAVTHNGRYLSVGKLSLTENEFAALQATLLDGQGRWLENEVVFEFKDDSKQSAFLEGK